MRSSIHRATRVVETKCLRRHSNTPATVTPIIRATTTCNAGSFRRRGIASEEKEIAARIASAAASPHANACVTAAAPRTR